MRLHARQVGAEIVISVLDDGRGVDLGLVREAAGRPDLDDAGALEAMFAPGISTARTVTPVSGRGIGLDAVRAAVEALHGSVDVDSAPGRGTDLRLRVPLTLAVLPCLILETAGRPYALPLHAVAHVLPAGAAGVVDDMPAAWLDGEPLPLADLARVLGAGAGPPAAGPVVLVRSPEGHHAFRVDALTGHRDVAVKELGGVLPRLELLAGAAVEPDAGILLVLDPAGLVAAAARVDAEAGAVPAVLPSFDPPPPARVLVVEDAPIIRELERSILSRAGYEVETACDGEEALERLNDHVPDLVLSDVDMPRMDGFALTEAIRAHPELNGVPVLLLTSRTDAEGRERGEDAGCDGYLVKERFDEHALVDAVAQLLGGRP